MADRQCFECDAHVADPWVSLSYGITLCINCAGRHRALGTHNSYVRSWTMDNWTDGMKRVMKCGGNDAALEYFNSKGIRDMPIEKRYATREAHQYSVDLFRRAEVDVPKGFMAPERCKTAEELRNEPETETARRAAAPAATRTARRRCCCGMCPC